MGKGEDERDRWKPSLGPRGPEPLATVLASSRGCFSTSRGPSEVSHVSGVGALTRTVSHAPSLRTGAPSLRTGAPLADEALFTLASWRVESGHQG